MTQEKINEKNRRNKARLLPTNNLAEAIRQMKMAEESQLSYTACLCTTSITERQNKIFKIQVQQIYHPSEGERRNKRERVVVKHPIKR